MSVIVTGMHRSGTSAVARVVEAFGLSLGAGPVMGGAADNPRGFFERRDVADFNDAWLRRLGGAWWAPPTTTAGTWRQLDETTLRDARAGLDLFDPDAPPWLSKDPRTALLLPLWDRLALREHPLVLCVRSPGEVAGSLGLRSGISPRRALALWLTYLAAALRHLGRRPTLVIDCAATLDHPAATVDALDAFLRDTGHTPHPGWSRRAADALIEPHLHRAGVPVVDELSEPHHEACHEIYRRLAHRHAQPTRDLGTIAVPGWVDEVLDELRELYRLTVARDAAERARDAFARRVADAPAAPAEATAALAAVQAERDAARTESEAARADAEAVRAERDAARAETDAARAERDAARGAYETVRVECDVARAESDVLRAERDAGRAEADAARAERDAARREIADLIVRLSARDADHATAVDRIDALTRALQDAAALAAERESALREAESAIDAELERAQLAEAQLAAALEAAVPLEAVVVTTGPSGEDDLAVAVELPPVIDALPITTAEPPAMVAIAAPAGLDEDIAAELDRREVELLAAAVERDRRRDAMREMSAELERRRARTWRAEALVQRLEAEVARLGAVAAAHDTLVEELLAARFERDNFRAALERSVAAHDDALAALEATQLARGWRLPRPLTGPGRVVRGGGGGGR